MGLLEDAIREHLELKRLRGADPAEVAREQNEVLDAPASAVPEAGAPDEAARSVLRRPRMGLVAVAVGILLVQRG